MALLLERAINESLLAWPGPYSGGRKKRVGMVFACHKAVQMVHDDANTHAYVYLFVHKGKSRALGRCQGWTRISNGEW
eukprot:1160122-Pelagomonas_calceolata.AAC.6